MDIYGTAVTAVDQVIKVTIFIKGVIDDIEAFEDDRQSLHLKLNLQLTTLEFFRRRFLDKEHGLMLPGYLPEWVIDTICELLLKMSEVLAGYQLLMHKYDVLDDHKEPTESQNETTSEREKWKQSFLERAKSKLKTLKLKGYDWAIFDKKHFLGVLDEYKGHTDSLRDIMQHFSQEAVYSLMANKHTPTTDTVSLEGTGLGPVFKRQKLITAHAPEDFQELEGEIKEDGVPSNRFQLAHWTHENGEQQLTQTVVVEYHEYDRRLRRDDLDSDEIAELKAPMKNLAWLLQNSTFTEGDEDPDQSEQPTIFSLQCLGYKDQVDNHRAVFIYRLPLRDQFTSGTDARESLVTLHDWINRVDSKTKRSLKPSLGDRFSIAHSLALTVLNVHGSLWVHKNIWSRGILLFQKDKKGIYTLNMNGKTTVSEPIESRNATSPRMLAFLADWGYARPFEGATEMRSDFDIEPNLYRHPERQGVPTRQFARRHDIYALGVVLLEIGLWHTVSQIFASKVKAAQQIGNLPKPKEVLATLISLAQGELPKEMGAGYSAAVLACLKGDFRKASDMELSLDFRKKVIDVTTLGMKL
ncbi:hypothetical protein M501DRAFT_932170 [Patellaria atrata CBS 101060]|uniref:Protein kinase domain-containing protein n=1 Tax=Patellaria atrata CBS 101060 TaxID=1346257 RepID=A0A9P4VQT6_9PEZI|nr:hypothetical protein M501DRAFT_932170 [Patellaria atrata CBS 101060]